MTYEPDPQPYSGIPSFCRCPVTRSLDGVDVAVLGVPYDGSTSHRSGCRFGARAIREQSLLLWGYNNALGVAPLTALTVIDYGDAAIVPGDVLATYDAIERSAEAVVNSGVNLIALGGDHSITLPLLRIHEKKHGPVAVVHFDAHPDTWDREFGECRYSHGTPFRRAIEEDLIDTSAYLQIGLRGPTLNSEDYEDARRLGARTITMSQVASNGISGILHEIHERVGEKALYVTLDIDCVDPAFAPGTGTPEVGGFTSIEIMQLVRGLQGLNLVGFDLVEVSPPYDHAGITAILGANIVFEFLSLLALERHST